MGADSINRQNGVPTRRPARVNHQGYLKLAAQAGGYSIARHLIAELVREQQLRHRSRIQRLVAPPVRYGAAHRQRNAAIERERDMAVREKAGAVNSQDAARRHAGTSLQR